MFWACKKTVTKASHKKLINKQSAKGEEPIAKANLWITLLLIAFMSSSLVF